MVGERNIVEVVVAVIDVERAPAAIPALHALDPFAPSRDRAVETIRAGRLLGAIHRHHDDGGVVEIGIVRVGVLEGPSARP